MPSRLYIALAACLVTPAAAQPAFFDDFGYAAIGEPDAPAEAGALFGRNAWFTGAGADTSRAWRIGWDDQLRYRDGDAAAWPTGGYALVPAPGPPGNRAVELRIRAGATPSDRYPNLFTGQVFPRHGTFAARVWFDAFVPGARQYAAFWAISPDRYLMCREDQPRCHCQPGDACAERPGGIETDPTGTPFIDHRAEVDFELSSLLRTDLTERYRVGTAQGWDHGLEIMSAGSIVARDDQFVARSAPLHCVFPGGRVLRECWLPPEGQPPSPTPMARRWYDAVLTLDSTAQVMTFLMAESPDSVGAGGPVWAGGARYGQPLRLGGRAERREGDALDAFPRMDMMAAFNTSFAGTYDGEADVLGRDYTMRADWFFFHPRPLSLDEVREHVARWRAAGRERVNTVGLPFVTPTPTTQHDGRGPLDVLALRLQERDAPGRTRRWDVDLASPRGIIYALEAEWRPCDEGGCAGRWRPLSRPYLQLTPQRGWQAVEIRARARDPWHGWTTPGWAEGRWVQWTRPLRP